MLKMNLVTGGPVRADGGYSKGLPIKDTYVQIGDGMRRVHGVLYEPVKFMAESRVGVIILHSDEDYSTFAIGPELAKRGFRALCGQVSDAEGVFDKKISDIGDTVNFLKRYEGIHKVILMGHSGGATLMSAYQSIAENGAGLYQMERCLCRCTITEFLTPADGVMLLDSNWGNGAMTLLSMDPAVVEEGNGMTLDPEFDLLSEKNGYSPAGSHYTEAFLKKYCEAQARRNNAVVKKALDRLTALEKGHGLFLDDEPFIVAGGAQFAPCNKLLPQDVRLAAHTKKAYDLMHADKTVTKEIVNCLRKSRPARRVSSLLESCLITTVRSFLSNRAVMAAGNYRIQEDGIEGIQWNDTYNCTPGNVRNISVPMLLMGMTGSYEYLASEIIYENASAEDKTICFSEGSGHNFFLQNGIETVPGEYGDPAKNVFDKAADWMRERFI